jgi:hypothetical protein
MMRFKPGTQTISWFQKEYKEGTITLRPPYQRKPVWAARQKCYLIESILYNMPVPEIFIHETTTPDGDTLHAVVDGQQRIRTVLQFLGLTTIGPDGKPEPDEDEFTGFALDKFDKRTVASPWLGKRFTDLSMEERVKVFEYTFHIRYLYTNEESELRNMFTRLNRYLTALNPQELRHATYIGPFPKLAEDLADNEFWLKSGLMTRALIRRLGDVEFVSQLLIGVIHGPEGGSAGVIDEYYRMYEDYDLEEGIPDQRRARRLFDNTLRFIQRLYPDLPADSDLRWGNKADFYTLFIALAEIIREHDAPKDRELPALRAALEKFSRAVNRRLGDENANVSARVIEYVRAVEKGVNDKARRADRHRIVVALIEETLGLEPSEDEDTTTRTKGPAKKR